MTNGISHMFCDHPVQQQQQLQEACEGGRNNIRNDPQECLVCCFIIRSENPNELWKDARKNASIPGKVAQHVRLLFAMNIGLLSATRKGTINVS